MTTTTDDAALLAAICAEPAEDTPRLAYADWLDEEGDVRVRCAMCNGAKVCPPEGFPMRKCRRCSGTGTVAGTANADRAEFIRVQVELARLRADGYHCYHDLTRPKHCEVCTRRVRSDELLRQYAGTWRPEVFTGSFSWVVNTGEVMWMPQGSPAAFPVTFTRGFISHVACAAREWTADRERRADLGECPACKGDGRFYGVFVEPSHANSGDPCPACSGTGRRTRGDGFAARCVLACPVAGVTLDREPGGEHDEHDRHWVRRLAHWTMPDYPHHLSPELFDRLEGGTTREDLQVRSSHYHFVDAARQSLSAACVAWARAEAGLPAIEAVA